MTIAPIYIMAAITLALSATLWGGLLYALSGRNRKLLWLLLPGLPLSAFANLVVKRPLVLWLGEIGQVEPGQGLATPLWFILALSLVSPVTEEAIKVLPLLLPAVRRQVDSLGSAVWVGLALGISFGLGEAAYLAYNVAQAPEYAEVPWYAFTGYLSERLVVSLVHGLLTMLVVVGLWRGGWRTLGGYLVAVLMHLVVNLGAILYQLDVIPAGAAGLSLLVALIVLAIIFERFRRQTAAEGEDGEQAEEVVYFERPRTGAPDP
jgi:uncharacterized membrane protein